MHGYQGRLDWWITYYYGPGSAEADGPYETETQAQAAMTERQSFYEDRGGIIVEAGSKSEAVSGYKARLYPRYDL